MSELTKQAAYLKGLLDGMKLDTEKDENKVLTAIVDYLGKMADELELMDQEQGFLADQIDDIEEVVEVLAEEVADGYDDFDDFGEYQLVCEACGEVITFTDDEIDEIVEGNFTCPACGETIELDLSAMEDEGCDCGCEN